MDGLLNMTISTLLFFGLLFILCVASILQFFWWQLKKHEAWVVWGVLAIALSYLFWYIFKGR